MHQWFPALPLPPLPPPWLILSHKVCFEHKPANDARLMQTSYSNSPAFQLRMTVQTEFISSPFLGWSKNHEDIKCPVVGWCWSLVLSCYNWKKKMSHQCPVGGGGGLIILGKLSQSINFVFSSENCFENLITISYYKLFSRFEFEGVL